jgi:hypothetical protein
MLYEDGKSMQDDMYKRLKSMQDDMYKHLKSRSHTTTTTVC